MNGNEKHFNIIDFEKLPIPRQYYIIKDWEDIKSTPYYNIKEVLTDRENKSPKEIYNDILGLTRNQFPIDGNALEQKLFPYSQFDVFISHLHTSLHGVRAIKAKIEHELKMTCFVDADIWSDLYTVLPFIQQNATKQCTPNNVYGLNNALATHLSQILSHAIHKIMDTAKVFLFICPENALGSNASDSIEINSEWVRDELEYSRTLFDKDILIRSLWSGPIDYSPLSKYNVNIEHLRPIYLENISYLKERSSLQYWENIKQQYEEIRDSFLRKSHGVIP